MCGDRPWEIDTSPGMVHKLCFLKPHWNLRQLPYVQVYGLAFQALFCKGVPLNCQQLSPAQAGFQKKLKCQRLDRPRQPVEVATHICSQQRLCRSPLHWVTRAPRQYCSGGRWAAGFWTSPITKPLISLPEPKDYKFPNRQELSTPSSNEGNVSHARKQPTEGSFLPQRGNHH